jgi:hypothetical protein
VLPPEEDSTCVPPEDAAGCVLPPEEELTGVVEPPLEVPMACVPPVPAGVPSDEDGLQATRLSTLTLSMGNNTSRD